jgi:hypothetical protein
MGRGVVGRRVGLAGRDAGRAGGRGEEPGEGSVVGSLGEPVAGGAVRVVTVSRETAGFGGAALRDG